MAIRINTNISAMTALRNLENTQDMFQGSITRLSSGLRINSAADDPAGLIITEGMQAQISGLGQALQNSQDAINMSKTADGAMSEVQTLLQNIRGLAVGSANTAVVDSNVLQANQAQIRSTIQSIDRIAQQTQFGSKKLLDGTAGVLANVTSTANVSSIYMGGTFGGQQIATGPITISKVVQATRATVPLGKVFGSANAIVGTAGSFVVNGYSFTSTGTDTVQSLVNKINTQSSTTGVSAQLVPNGAGVSVSLVNNDYGSQYNVSFFDPSNILNNAAAANSTGVDAVFNVQATTAGTPAVVSSLFTGGRGPQESGLKLTDTYGNTIVMNENGNANVAGATQVGVVTAGTVRFQIGAFADQNVGFAMPTVFSSNLGTGAVPGESIATLDVTTQQGAQDAIKVIDDAITQLARTRGDLGSFQKNFLESNTRSLNVAQENLTASESSIKDADMASEITQFTRLQILQSSGMSVLAQANQQPQSILKLLQ